MIGDGRSSIQQLINEVNRHPARGDGHQNVLTKIQAGPTTKLILSRKNYTLNTVLKLNEIFYLEDAANLSKGGTAEDVTDQVHPDVVKVAGESSEIVKRGVESSCFNPPVVCIPNEKQALLFAMENALPGTLVMLCVEKIEEIISMLNLM